MKVGPACIEKPELSSLAIIGDVHSCYHELTQLLELIEKQSSTLRTLVFVGDLIDRGPKPVEVLKLVMQLQQAGRALSVNGNHDEKLYRWLSGKNVQLWHGLEFTAEQLKKEPRAFQEQVRRFMADLPFQLILDNNQLLIAHAGLSERLQKQDSEAMRSFALYGDTTGQKDQFGFPVRRDWAKEYSGKRMVVYGHTPLIKPYWKNNTVNIDTGCAFGGKLTALLYPENEILHVDAHRKYTEPTKPLQLME